MGFHNFVNTAYFSEAANDFLKNGKHYTTAPRGSRDYYDYWELHDKRCMDGYSVGGLWIPGRYYFYLNFFPMEKISDEAAASAYFQFKKVQALRLQGIKIDYPNITAEKNQGFPRFTEVGYEWHMFKHIAWHGGEFMGIDSPGARHIGALKARGAGFSYSEACDGVYNYTFLDGSKSYYFAGTEDYLIKDGILNKVEPALNFINEHIPYWKKNRGKKSTLMHQKASWLDEKGAEQGIDGDRMSEIMGVIVDNPNKTRGKRGRKITFEEGGSFPRLKEALEISLGSIRDGTAYVGQSAVFGTGGEEGPGIEGLDEIFNSPEAWDMLVFPNVWEEGMESESCGYFVPCWRVNNLAIDPEGNVDADLAVDLENVERAKKLKSSDPKAIDRRKAEYPTNPSEALMRLTMNNFPIAEVDAQIRRMRTNRTLQGYLRYGKFIEGKGGPEFMPDQNSKPLIKYPHTNNDDLSGCITIMEEPFKIMYEGIMQVPGEEIGSVYFITVDPIQLEDAKDLTSLWAIYVWKNYNPYDTKNVGVPVAWYVGRPKRLEDAWDIIFQFARYYRAKVQCEIAGGGQAVYTHAKQQKLLAYIAYEMSLDTKEIDATELKKNRSYFVNVTLGMKNEALKYLINWTTEQRGILEDGTRAITLHYIYDLGFLMEMKKFKADRNADRISQALLAMLMLTKGKLQYENLQQQSLQNAKPGFFNRQLFSGSQSRGSNVTSAF